MGIYDGIGGQLPNLVINYKKPIDHTILDIS